MPNITDVLEIPKRICPVIYVIDMCDYMNGEHKSKINQTMRDVISMMSRIDNSDFEFQINVISNYTECMWMHNELQPADKFEWKELHINNETNPLLLLEELNKQLSRDKMLKDDAKLFACPYIVLISDRTHAPTEEWENAVERVTNENRWFKYSNKLAISITDDANIDYLLKFVKSIEMIVPLKNAIFLHSLMLKYYGSSKWIGEYLKEFSVSKSFKEPIKDESRKECEWE